MANNIAICTTYFIEMLIAYIFFSQIGEKKYNIWCCCLIGTAVFEVGALSDIVFSNTIWINALMFIIINFFFALFCFNIKTTKILFYSIINKTRTRLIKVTIILNKIIKILQSYMYLITGLE